MKFDPHFNIAQITRLCSINQDEGACGKSCIVYPVCNKPVTEWPKDPSTDRPAILNLHDLYAAAQEPMRICQCPTLTVKGFTNVQRYLGPRTSIEKESAAIQQGAYPFAFAVNMTHSEYVIFAEMYLAWIKERSNPEYMK